MLFLNEVPNMKLMKRDSLLPINLEDKRKGSLIYLLAPNYESAITTSIYPKFINRANSFRAYYIPKDSTYYINGETLQESSIWYPNNEDFDEYCTSILENSKLNEFENNEVLESFKPGILGEDVEICDAYIRNRSTITFFPDAILTEDAKYDTVLRKFLYNERFKTNNEVLELYKKVKDDNPNITKTFVNLKLYKGFNLFVDLSYYTHLFFKNNYWKAEKAMGLFYDFMLRLLQDKRFKDEGYKVKTVFIPIDDWNINKDDINKFIDYHKSINPISTFIFMARKHPEQLKELKGLNFVFLGEENYFTADISTLTKASSVKFITLLRRVISKDLVTDDINDPDKDSTAVIVTKIIDKLEENPNSQIEVKNLLGIKELISKDELNERKKKAVSSKSAPSKSTTKKEAETKTKEVKKEKAEESKEVLVQTIAKAAEETGDTDKTIEQLDTDPDIAKLIENIADDGEEPAVKITVARQNRLTQVNSEFNKTKFKGKTISEYIAEADEADPLPETKIPIDSINSDWDHIKSINFNKEYDLDADILAIIESFSRKTYPIVVKEIDVENTSTSEDFIETWTLKCEDSVGQRFTLKFDEPLFVNKTFMKLRGNLKNIQGQLLLLPIIKTEQDTSQIVTNYNKIFMRRKITTAGKSNQTADRILKTLRKHEFTNIKLVEGDMSKLSAKYELPIDYIDIGSVYAIITVTIGDTKKVIMFNQDDIRQEIKVDEKEDELVVGYKITGNKKQPMIFKPSPNCPTFSKYLLSELSFATTKDKETFIDLYDQTSVSSRYTYSDCSILNTEIPTIVIASYAEGLATVLSKAKIKYTISEKRSKDLLEEYDEYIKFKDGYLYYKSDYGSMLLMNGLSACATEMYSIADINKKDMWIDFLDNFGGRIKADGLDNFYDLLMDPITVSVCKDYKLPYDYVETLIYANNLLADSKYNKHVDISGNRFRTNEIIAGYTYKALAASYGTYKNNLKRGHKGAMTIKQSAVIDLCMTDPTMSDLSILNPLLETETANSVTFKGLSGMNSERSYGLDKRTYDQSMSGIIAMSTGFAGNVGITRQATINMNIENTKGYIKTNNSKNMSSINTLCMTEALTPFGTTHDDPFRSAMTFVQTSKHQMKSKHASPALITNGADQALPYLTTDIFAHKSKGKGKITKKTSEYMIVTYEDKTKEFIDLRERVEKNSDGGFYVTLKLSSDLKEGATVKPNQILAYDKESYSTEIGTGAVAYNLGTLSKIAIMTTDECFEDSAIVSQWLSKALSSDIVVQKPYTLPKNTNVLYMVKKGQKVEEGDNLLLFQNSFDEEDVNTLMKTLADDGEDTLSDLGRIHIRSKNTGIVQDIKVYRTVDLNELSPSLKKICKEYEDGVSKLRAASKGTENEYIVNGDIGEPDKLPAIGKLKNAVDSVMIEFYIKYEDDFSVGDKLVVQSALKGVCKDMFPPGEEPTSTYRPKEPIDAYLSTLSISARMVCSVEVSGGINKILIELARQVKDIMGIKYEENVHGNFKV